MGGRLKDKKDPENAKMLLSIYSIIPTTSVSQGNIFEVEEKQT
jgi:hypothetical protein